MDANNISKGSTSCPWCGEVTVPKVSVFKGQNRNVRERRCANCGKVLAAYLIEEGNFMTRIRKFEN